MAMSRIFALLQKAERIGALSPHEDVAGDRQRIYQRGVLVDGFDARIGGIGPAGEHRLLTIDTQVARGGLVDPRNEVNGGRLAGAVVAQKTDDFAWADVETQVAERRQCAKAL
jgi:hypothetical protein